MIYCDEHDPEVYKDCGVTECDNKPKRRGEDEAELIKELILQQINLQKNAAKGGWGECSPYFLVRRGIEEMREIIEALDVFHDNHCEATKQHVLAECGDAAAFAMMIADIVSDIEVETNNET